MKYTVLIVHEHGSPWDVAYVCVAQGEQSIADMQAELVRQEMDVDVNELNLTSAAVEERRQFLAMVRESFESTILIGERPE